jgi:mannose-6-phosphate isomerase-like protein (cupin superfamily)
MGRDTCSYVVQFDIRPGDRSWHAEVFPDGRLELAVGASESAVFIFVTEESTLLDILEERMTGFTAAAQATGADAVPLAVKSTEAAGRLSNPRNALLGFTQDFFNRSWPERIRLGEEHSRVVHGAHAIPLYYGQGFRSAWYMVKKGQRLNEPGDTNPFPQAFVIISGAGMAKIGDLTIRVRAGESYYIPPESDHVLWTENDDGITLIWFGWGEGA